MHGHHIYSRVWINRVRLPILPVVSWTGKMNIPLSPCVPENLVSRDGFIQPSRPASACSSPYSGWIWCLLTGFLPSSAATSIYEPPYAIGSVPSFSGHAIACRWRSLPRVRRHRASKPQGSSERVLPWQVTMEQFIFASLSHSHYWHEVGMSKVPAVCTFSIREDGDRKILRQDTKACVWPTHKNQEKTPEIHTAFRICRLLAFTPNTM